jgi:hypothetical protein
MSAPLIQIAIANDAIMLYLPSKTTNITQPLVVIVFCKMKIETSKLMHSAKMIKSDLWVAKKTVSAMFEVIF